mmetsp:Transcript_11377/g.34190  ORF Transcript_11377/g.34190 Transcript_11377/m.34190 type:complete len:212 (-) Transcript_11377:637-1272(-)
MLLLTGAEEATTGSRSSRRPWVRATCRTASTAGTCTLAGWTESRCPMSACSAAGTSVSNGGSAYTVTCSLSSRNGSPSLEHLVLRASTSEMVTSGTADVSPAEGASEGRLGLPDMSACPVRAAVNGCSHACCQASSPVAAPSSDRSSRRKATSSAPHSAAAALHTLRVSIAARQPWSSLGCSTSRACAPSRGASTARGAHLLLRLSPRARS